ncbi:MAG: hypothetical protein ACI4N3_02185 [Alphaproteobacteria bacterium]
MRNINKRALLKQFHLSNEADIFRVNIGKTYRKMDTNFVGDTNFIGVKQFIHFSKEKIIKPCSIYTNFIYDFKNKKVDILPLLFNKNEFIKDVGFYWIYTDTFVMSFHKLGKLENLRVNDDNTLSPEFEDIITQVIVQENLKDRTVFLTDMGPLIDTGSNVKAKKIVVSADDVSANSFDKINTNIIDMQFTR